MLIALLALHIFAANAGHDPFVFFQPSVTLSADDRRRLDHGEPIARTVPGEDGEVAVFAAVPIAIDGHRVVAWMRRIEALKKSAYVAAIGRFSDPPRIQDLAALALDDDELAEIIACRPRDCSLKLSAGEMTRLAAAAANAKHDWKAALQHEFRCVVLERVTTYLADGHGALAPYDNQKGQVHPDARFAALLGHSVFLTTRMPEFAEHLRGYPRTRMPEVESFVYWSKERLAGKAIVSATHLSILLSRDPGLPETLVAGKEIFATHYVNASFGVTAVLRGEPGGPNYLTYLNRSEVDVLGGVFGGLVRWMVQRRLKAEAAEVLQGLRKRLEGGEPPPLAKMVP